MHQFNDYGDVDGDCDGGDDDDGNDDDGDDDDDDGKHMWVGCDN